MLDVSAASDQHADLSPDIAAQLAQLTGKFGAEQTISGQPPTKEAFKVANLPGLEAAGISKNLDEGLRGWEVGGGA